MERKDPGRDEKGRICHYRHIAEFLWKRTEIKLNEFLNRQNSDGLKLILPILHHITIAQLRGKYPSVADIQAIDSDEYSCDQIALLFAKQMIRRFRSG